MTSNISLDQINREFNINLNLLNDYMNQQTILLSRLNSYSRKLKMQQLQGYYKQQYINLINRKKQLISGLNKLINSALIVGINYIGSEYELSGCINDANTIRDFAVNHGCDNIIMLSEKDRLRPSKLNILVGLTNLLKNSKSGDVVLFYYSGHGSNIKDTNGDEKDELDEVLVSVDFKSISDDELNQVIKTNLKSDVSLFIMCDCCHSGTMIDLKYNYNEDSTVTKDVDMPGNVYYISGCRDTQTSMETSIDNKTQGLLTNCFVNIMKETPNIMWNDLMNTLRIKLREMNYPQLPQLSTSHLIYTKTAMCFF
jgi:hypothetical protein